MVENTLEILSYSIETAYRISKTMDEAVESVKSKYPEADMNILLAMWYAIDAYVDINE